GQKAGNIRVYLFRSAAITGTAVDEAGEPAVGIQIRAYRRDLVGTERRFVAAGPIGWTDDRGIYRLGGLAPGDYLVAATATQASVPALSREQWRKSAAGTAIADIGASAESGPTTMRVGESLVTLGKSAIGPPPSTDAHLVVYPTTFHPDTASPNRAPLISL